MKIVVITAYASIDTAVEAIRRGATDYIPKPFKPDQVAAANPTVYFSIPPNRVVELGTQVKL